MCTILFALNQHPKYKLIYLGNRDEFTSYGD
ncbi:NRDE family protein [Fusibacter sp. 3D3]